MLAAFWERWCRFWGLFACCFGCHPWREEGRYRGPALIISLCVIAREDAVHIIDHCPRCGTWWRSVEAMGDRTFTEEFEPSAGRLDAMRQGFAAFQPVQEESCSKS